MESRELLHLLLYDAVKNRAQQARNALAPILEYDAAHGGDLLRTLHTYLAHNCNASRTAHALYLHRSGLLYRLGRIEDLLGVRLTSFEDRVALEVAVLSVTAGWSYS